MEDRSNEAIPDRDEWDSIERWRSVAVRYDGEEQTARKLHAAYRLGRFRGYVQGEGLGRQKGFKALFNLLVDLRDKAVIEQEDALKNQRHALAKTYGRTRYAMETALGLVQQMFTIADVIAQQRNAEPAPEVEPS